MRVVINEAYTYETGDLTVKVGDIVQLPPSDSKMILRGNDLWEGIVTSLESDYTGPCKNIVKIIVEMSGDVEEDEINIHRLIPIVKGRKKTRTLFFGS